MQCAKISLANPTRFLKMKARLLPFFSLFFVGFLVPGLYTALVSSPVDYQMGDAVRIMYVHVPAAWMAMGVYAMMAVSAVMALVWRHPLAEIAVRAAAPIGAAFTLISLVTGSIWGKPMWGTWWVWDARLTSVLFLFFLYVGYIALVEAHEVRQKGARMGNYLILVGAVNLPIIKWSVTFWNTLHQPASLMKMSGPTIDPQMLMPLFFMFGAYVSFFGLILLLNIESEILRRKIYVLTHMNQDAWREPGHMEAAA